MTTAADDPLGAAIAVGSVALALLAFTDAYLIAGKLDRAEATEASR
ncbi:hypothetical protein [Halorubrum salinum]|nr:hypothetical protein [Halorubrum salinum]